VRRHSNHTLWPTYMEALVSDDDDHGCAVVRRHLLAHGTHE
jgi:hypothetical protein